MRIISQDGRVDVPYEQIALSIGLRYIEETYAIDAKFINRQFEIRNLAVYSTLEKAKSAMELLQQAYTGRYITNADIQQEDFDKTMQELMKHGLGTVVARDRYDSRVEFGNLNGYFKFPAEEEIEV